jgi:UTP--glucose-1-phosphate uridylyltransferase
MAIRTALITASGFGSRFFPVSKSVQKEMLPVLNRPVLDYLVDDCIAAGITNIIVTVREGQPLVPYYYTEQPAVKQFFNERGWGEKYTALEDLHSKATFTFVVQRHEDGYGTGVPVKLAQQYLEGEEAFLYLTGDDFTYQGHGTSTAAQLMQVWEETRASAVLSCREVEADMTHKYGIVETREESGKQFLSTFIEKPAQGTTSSRLANISKYVFTSSIFPLLVDQGMDEKSGELYITDTVLNLSKQQPVAVHVPQGDYLDCGNVAGWLKANLRVAAEDPALWAELSRYMAELKSPHAA